jgi:DHA1 family multidrug resistance protein-like MFS transporter
LTTAAARPWRSALVERIGGGAGNGSVLVIALGAGVASLSMNFWIPFLPIYMKHLGATSDANALFWVGVATTGQGIARLVAGPAWGILSDRVGRKLMFIRALYFATGTTFIAAFATEPWHVAIAFACQGLFSGFIPAAVALTSVTVPESKLGSSLGTVTAAQYLGNTVGPAIGALLAVGLGMRGAIFAAAIMPALAATLVLFVVPRDRTSDREEATAAASEATAGATKAAALLSAQFGLAIFLYFILFSTGQVLRLTAPVAIEDFTGSEATGISGLAFSVAGVASVIGVVFVARRFVQPGRFAMTMGAGMLLTAVAHVLLAASPGVWIYVAWFSVISLIQAALLPASNTLIASNVPRHRRGTAFGIAGSAQALAFMVGPMSAAIFAAISLSFGYLVLGGLFVVVSAIAWACIREPKPAPG